MTDIIGQATVVSEADAKAHYEAGGTILVSENTPDTIPVSTITTVHSHTQGITDWDELHEQVRMWANRYPRQRFYTVTYT